MKHLLLFLTVVTLSLSLYAQDDNHTTYYFIRHAEKANDKSNDRDPNLSEIGKTRAKRWSTVFRDVNFDAIYSTDYKRTRQTAQPIADDQQQELTLYDPRVLNSAEFSSQTKGKTILIVGHSNTTPAFVNAILGLRKYPDIEHNEFGQLYIVTITNTGEKLDHLLTIN